MTMEESGLKAMDDAERPSVLWMSRSFLFRGQPLAIAIPEDAGWPARLAIRLENPGRVGKVHDAVNFYVGIVIPGFLTIVGGLEFRIISGALFIMVLSFAVSTKFTWLRNGGWRYMKTDGWGWRPECQIYRRARKPRYHKR